MEEQANLLAVILRSAEEPVLNRPQMLRVARAARAHQAYIRTRMEADDSDDDEGPQDEEAWLFEDLSILAKLYARMKDREQLIELIFQVESSLCSSSASLNSVMSVGHHRRAFERYHHDILRSTRPSVPSGEYRRLLGRSPELHE